MFEMLEILKVDPVVVHAVEQSELRRVIGDEMLVQAYTDCLYDEFNHTSYSDGDFTCRVDLRQPTPEDEDDFTWVHHMRFHLPDYVIRTNKFAINFYR